MPARILSLLPILAIFAAFALLGYLYLSYKQSPARAKEVLIKLFIILSVALCAVFILICIYSLLDNNEMIFELSAALLVISIAMLLVVLICRYIFLKHNPSYKLPRNKSRIHNGRMKK